MRQLALDLKLADYARFDTFYPGPNATALRAVRGAALASSTQVHWVWGRPGSGRSHLLQAAVAAAGEAGQAAAWLPLGSGDMQPGMLEGMGQLDLLCVDDIDGVAGSREWEHALFRVFEELRAGGGRLIAAASAPAADAGFGLRDLASRLASGPTWKLATMDDDARLAALQLRSRWRGLELPDETGRYLLRRADRDSAALFRLLDKLDEAALAAQRRLTVPFVSSVINDLPAD
jgi:DnaA family protein